MTIMQIMSNIGVKSTVMVMETSDSIINFLQIKYG